MEDIKKVAERLKEWVDDSGWVHFHHNSDPRHFTDYFADFPHHMGFLVRGLIINDLYDDFWANTFYKGFVARTKFAKFERDPKKIGKDGKKMNIDQWSMILWPALEGIGEDIVLTEWKRWRKGAWYNPRKWLWRPPHWIHFKRSWGIKSWYPVRAFCDWFEFLDTKMDTSQSELSESSAVKNFFRMDLAMDFYPTKTMKKAFRYSLENIDYEKVFKVYFTRGWEPPINHPPIHLLWIGRIRQRRRLFGLGEDF